MMNRNKSKIGTLDELHKENLEAIEILAGDAQERIRVLAYMIWEDRVTSGEPGDDVSDWLAAERIVVGPQRQPRRRR